MSGYNKEWYSLHEVYYGADGSPAAYVEQAEAIGDTIEELIDSLSLMIRDTKAHKKALAEKKKYKMGKGKKGKVILEKKDFEEGGIYFSVVTPFDDIDTLKLPTLPTPKNVKLRKSKGPRKVGRKTGNKASKK